VSETESGFGRRTLWDEMAAISGRSQQRDSDRRAWVAGAIGGVDLAPFGDAMCEIVEDTRPT
jgi:hypothetical protein